MAASIALTDSLASDANSSSYSKSCSIGAAASDRIVVVAVAGRAGGAPTLSCTIGGVSAASAVVRLNSGSVTELFYLAVPSGTTATVVVTSSIELVRLGFSVYRVIGAEATPGATGSGAGNSGATSLTASMTAANPGVGVASAYAARSTIQRATTASGAVTAGSLNFVANIDAGDSSATWTGLTEDVDATLETAVASAQSIVGAVWYEAAGLTPISGDASGSLVIAGASTGSVRANGAATGSMALAGASTGSAQVRGAAAGAIALNGSATASATVTGAANGAIGLTGAATASVAVAGLASGSIAFAGSASGGTGELPIEGQASGTLDLVGAAVGSVSVTGASAGSIALTGSAVAAAGEVTIEGAASGTLGLTGSASASASISGQASGYIALTGVSTVQVTINGVATGSLDLSGSAVGRLVNYPVSDRRTVGGVRVGRVRSTQRPARIAVSARRIR